MTAAWVDHVYWMSECDV